MMVISSQLKLIVHIKDLRLKLEKYPTIFRKNISSKPQKHKINKKKKLKGFWSQDWTKLQREKNPNESYS